MIEAGGRSSDAQRQTFLSLREDAFRRPTLDREAPNVVLDDTEGAS